MSVAISALIERRLSAKGHSKEADVAHAIGNNFSEESTKQRQMQPEMYLTRQEQINNGESKSTQYLTRFSNLPTSLGQGREKEILLIQQSIQTNTEGYLRNLPSISLDSIHEDSNPYL